MSNFKEIYPQVNFREDLHRMDSLGEDGYEVWAYNGKPDNAPLSAEYSYELVKNTKKAYGRDIIINDGINMPLESFKLYGESTQSGTPTMTSSKAITKKGILNSSTGNYEIKCYTAENINHKELIYSPQPLCSLQNGVKDYYENGYVYLKTIYDSFKNTDNWQLDNVYSNNVVTVISLFLSNAKNNSTDIWCTHFKANEDLSQPNRIKIKDQRVYVSADAARYPDLGSFLNWIDNGKVFICYERKNKIKVPSQPYVLLDSCEGQTEIINDQNAEMEIEYRIAPNARVWQKQEDGTFIELTQ